MLTKKWTWSTTGHQLNAMSHDEIIAFCPEAGLAGIEGAPYQFEGLTGKALDQIGERYRAAGVRIETFHLPMTAESDIAAFYETDRLHAVQVVRTWMERSARIGATIGVQHPTMSSYSVETEGLDNFVRQLGRSLRTLLPEAERLNYTIALENMMPGSRGPRLGARPEHFARIIKEFDHPHLGCVLDTGHALVAAGPDHADEFHAVLAPHLVAYHLSDNAGDRDSHLAPGHGRVDWTRVFRRAAKIGYAGCMCIETPPFAAGANGTYSVAAWRQLVQDTDRLATAALEGVS